MTFARTLGDLARLNESYEASKRGKADFNRWSPVAQSLLATLEHLTDNRLPAQPRDSQHPSSPDPWARST